MVVDSCWLSNRGLGCQIDWQRRCRESCPVAVAVLFDVLRCRPVVGVVESVAWEFARTVSRRGFRLGGLAAFNREDDHRCDGGDLGLLRGLIGRGRENERRESFQVFSSSHVYPLFMILVLFKMKGEGIVFFFFFF